MLIFTSYFHVWCFYGFYIHYSPHCCLSYLYITCVKYNIYIYIPMTHSIHFHHYITITIDPIKMPIVFLVWNLRSNTCGFCAGIFLPSATGGNHQCLHATSQQFPNEIPLWNPNEIPISLYEIPLWNPNFPLWNPFMKSLYEIPLWNPFMTPTKPGDSYRSQRHRVLRPRNAHDATAIAHMGHPNLPGQKTSHWMLWVYRHGWCHH